MSSISLSFRNPLFGLSLVVVFLAVMALFFIHYDAYRDIGSDLVSGGSFDANPLSSSATWRARGPHVVWEAQGGMDGTGGVRLEPGAGRGSSLNHTVERWGDARMLRVSAWLRTDQVVHGPNSWNTARVLVSLVDREGYRVAHTICELTGSTSWQRCEGVVPVAADTSAVQINVQNLAASGSLWVDDLKLVPATEKSMATYWRTGFALLWGAVLVYCGWLARLLERPLGLAIIAIVMVITFGVAAPEGAIEMIVDRGADAVNGLAVPESPSTAPAAAAAPDVRPRWTHELRRALGWPFGLVLTVKKLGHFVLFALLAWLAFSSVAHRRELVTTDVLTTTGAALLLFAAAAEVIQFLTTTRTPSFTDWIIDTAGIVVGASLAIIWSRMSGSRPAGRADAKVGEQVS